MVQIRGSDTFIAVAAVELLGMNEACRVDSNQDSGARGLRTHLDSSAVRRDGVAAASGPLGRGSGRSRSLARTASPSGAALPALRPVADDVAKHSPNLGSKGIRACFGSPRVSDEHDIHRSSEPMKFVARRLSQPPLDAVSRDRIAHLSTDCQPHTT